MDVLTKGAPARLEDVPNGECFMFEARDQIAIGMKVAYPESPNSRVLVLTHGAGRPPSLQDRQEARPTIAYRQRALAVVTDVTPSRVRNGFSSPHPGHITQLENEIYIGFVDEQYDSSAVSLKTGLINPNPLKGPAAVFETWKIVFSGGGEPKIVFAYPPK